jgi:hypothetical protein
MTLHQLCMPSMMPLLRSHPREISVMALFCMILILLLCLSPAGALGKNGTNSRAPDLIDFDGAAWTANACWRVVVFVDGECPVANAALPAIKNLAAEFDRRDVVFGVAYVDPTAPKEKMRAHAKEYGIERFALNDQEQRFATHVGATYLSEAVVLDASGAVRYLGRIDDRAGAPGASRPTATQHDLRTALKQLIEGAPGFITGPKGFGCPLPQKVVQ